MAHEERCESRRKGGGEGKVRVDGRCCATMATEWRMCKMAGP
jgi:hypothetical protein